jgi:heat shock protein HslJ
MKQFIILTFLSAALLACNNTANHKTVGILQQELAGKWLISSIDEQTVINNAVPTLTFDINLSLSGQASCNNFLTHYIIDNKTLGMGPIKTTRKMCSPELMQQESKLLKVLTKVKRFQVDNDQLTLLDQQGKPQLRAQRVKSSI